MFDFTTYSKHVLRDYVVSFLFGLILLCELAELHEVKAQSFRFFYEEGGGLSSHLKLSCSCFLHGVSFCARSSHAGHFLCSFFLFSRGLFFVVFYQ